MVAIKRLLDFGMRFIGTPYVWGGSTPQGFDCSGLVQYVYGGMGVNLPRVSSQQARYGRGVSIYDAQPGDLVAFDNSSARPGVDHIGIYLGNGKMLQAPRKGRNVEVVDVDLRRATTIRRVQENSAADYTGLRGLSGGGYAYDAPTTQGGTQPGTISYVTGGSDPAVQPVSRDEAIASYGYIAQLADSVPDIKRLLNRGIAEGWTPQRFTAEVQNTAWWKKTAATQRQAQVLKATDPAEYAKQLANKRTAITILARQLGASMDSKRLDELSAKALEQGWSTQEMTRYVVADVKFVGGTAKGQAGVTQRELTEQASQYLVNPTATQVQDWTRRILLGETDVAAYETWLKQQAKALFPSLAGALDRGVTVAQYLEPYRQLAAQTLEMPAESIDFRQSKFRDPLFQVDPKTGMRGTMSLSDYDRYLRSQPEYRTTQQAREAGASLTETLLRTFGKVA